MRSLLAPLLLLVNSVHGHYMITNVAFDGVDQGAGTCLRIPPNTDPFTDVASDNMACNIDGATHVDRTCATEAGATVALQWRDWPDDSKDVPIDVSHQGPCSIYMKKMGDKGSGKAAGDGWFKIWDYGVKDGKFCTERLRENGGIMKAVIPKDLAGGYYLLRGEHLALHEAENIGGAQWYIGCVQLFLYSTGGNASPPTVSIPGYVSPTDPGVLFNYWDNANRLAQVNYKIPGPAPYVPTSAGGGKKIDASYDRGYTECLVSNGNWCAVSVPGFTDEDSCWQAADNCLSQLTTCYDTAGPTGHKGCTKWESVCTGYQNFCTACGAKQNCNGNFPPIDSYKKRSMVFRA